MIVVFQATRCYLSTEGNEAYGCYIWSTTVVAVGEARLFNVVFEGTTILTLMKPRLLAPIFGSITTLVLRETKRLDFQLRFSLYVSKTKPFISYGLTHHYNMMAKRHLSLWIGHWEEVQVLLLLYIS